MTEKNFLTVAEVADLLRVAPMTVRRWIDAGTLPAVRIGRSYRIAEADVERLIERHRTGGDE